MRKEQKTAVCLKTRGEEGYRGKAQGETGKGEWGLGKKPQRGGQQMHT